jgi:hypothetical protein
MNFGAAIDALKAGKMVRRSAHGHFEFIFMQVPSTVPAVVVPGMTSLPQAVKDEFANRFDTSATRARGIRYDNQLAFVTADNRISGWAPSVEDVMADDWMIVEWQSIEK